MQRSTRVVTPIADVRRKAKIRVVPTPRTYAEASAFIAEFEALRLPKARWTHESHLVAGLWYVWHLGADAARATLRVMIRDHNSSVGIANTDTSGYHETITRLYIEAIARLRESVPGETFEEVLDRLLDSPLAVSSWPLSYYSKDKLFSVKARHEWVPPEFPSGRPRCAPPAQRGR